MVPTKLRLVAMPLACALLCRTGWAESTTASITFDWIGAHYHGYFAPSSTGTVSVTVPPGIAPAGPLHLTHAPLASGDAVTTVGVYDPQTTFSFLLPVQDCSFGPHYLLVRLPEAGLMRWTYFIRRPVSAPAAAQSVTSAALRADYRDLVLRRLASLFDEETSGTWMGSDPDKDYHYIREDAYHASALFARGDAASVARANATLSRLCSAQDRLSTSGHQYGVFYLNGTDRRVHSDAVNFFATPLLARWLLEPPAGLQSSTRAEMREAIGYSCEFLDFRFRIGYSLDHTNFQALGIAGLALSAKALGHAAYLDRARQQMQGWYDHVIPRGGTFEYNSPVYTGVTQWALMMIIEQADDALLVAQARVLLERFWLDAALFHHPELRCFAGPYSRAYEDIVYGGTNLAGFLLSSELSLGGYADPGRLAENYNALHSHDTNPAHFESTLRPEMSSELEQVFRSRHLPASSWQKTRVGDAASHLRDSFTLGTVSGGVLNGGEGFLLQVATPEAPGGIAPVFARSGATSAQAVDYDIHPGAGVFALQDGPKAVVMVDRTLPPGEPATRAFFSLVADERFAEWEDLRIGLTPVSVPGTLTTSDTLFLRRADAYVAIRPLYGAAAGVRNRIGAVTRAEGHLNVSLHAVDSSEPLALAGTRIEAGFAVLCADRAAWPTYEAFIEDVLAASWFRVAESATTRTLTWNWQGSLECEFERGSGSFLSRRVNGLPLSGHLVDSEFAQQTSDGSVSLRDLEITGLPAASWVVYPIDSATALVVNPAPTAALLTSNWTDGPVEIGPHEQLRLARPPSSHVGGWMYY